uniref:Uncharacterized protein n=1 Tax=Romanomermis culicivorax TaxID=13658 RepID=A0A915JTJ9_ROMCU
LTNTTAGQVSTAAVGGRNLSTSAGGNFTSSSSMNASSGSQGSPFNMGRIPLIIAGVPAPAPGTAAPRTIAITKPASRQKG